MKREWGAAGKVLVETSTKKKEPPKLSNKKILHLLSLNTPLTEKQIIFS